MSPLTKCETFQEIEHWVGKTINWKCYFKFFLDSKRDQSYYLYLPERAVDYPQPQLLTNLRKKAFENIVGKGEMLVTRKVFDPTQREFLFLSYIYFVVCKCFQFRPV